AGQPHGGHGGARAAHHAAPDALTGAALGADPAPARRRSNRAARETMAAIISAYPAGISARPSPSNQAIVAVEISANARRTPKEPSPQCVSDDTPAPSIPTMPAP